MTFEIRPMEAEEQKYTFSQSQQIVCMTSQVGVAQIKIHDDGLEKTWKTTITRIATPEFQEDFSFIYQELERLFTKSDRNVFATFVNASPYMDMSKAGDFLGARINTDKYSYLLRYSPETEEAVCYCYEKKSLDYLINKARAGIRFIDSSYKTLFRLPDGGVLRCVFRWNHETKDYVCRYIDETHVEVGNNLYHICEFAEIMERNQNTYGPFVPEDLEPEKEQ